MHPVTMYASRRWNLPAADLLQTSSEISRLRETALPFISRLRSKPQVTGLGLLGLLGLLGGLAGGGIRHFADKLISERA
jgi:hypothetical protein